MMKTIYFDPVLTKFQTEHSEPFRAHSYRLRARTLYKFRALFYQRVYELIVSLNRNSYKRFIDNDHKT